ncbi:cupin domain-containing protein [Actinosynnema sp. NPDC049800]
MTTLFEFDEWSRFTETHWERRPAVLRTPLTAAMSAPDHFAALVSAADAWRAGRLVRPRDVRMLMGDGEVKSNSMAPLLPRAQDGDITSYIRRVDEHAHGDWHIVVNSLQQFSWPLFSAAKEILDGIYRAAGSVPAGLTDCHLIAGSYGEAPTRIHKDTATVMTFVLSGRKRFYTWPYETLVRYARTPDPLHHQVNLDIDFRDVVDQATVLEGEAGDVLYWPSDHWHCGESDGTPHLSVHLATYTDNNLVRTLDSLVSTALAERKADHWLDGFPYPPRVGAAPDTVTNKAMAEMLVEIADEIPARFQAKRLRRASAVNFEFVPPPRGSAFSGDHARVDARFPVLFEPTADHGDALLIAVNGHVSKIPRLPWLEDLLSALNGAGSSGLDYREHLGRTLPAAEVAGAVSAATQVLRFIDSAGGLVRP